MGPRDGVIKDHTVLSGKKKEPRIQSLSAYPFLVAVTIDLALELEKFDFVRTPPIKSATC